MKIYGAPTDIKKYQILKEILKSKEKVEFEVKKGNSEYKVKVTLEGHGLCCYDIRNRIISGWPSEGWSQTYLKREVINRKGGKNMSDDKYKLEYKEIPIDLRTDPIRYTKEYHLLYCPREGGRDQIIAKFRAENREEARKCVEFLNRMDKT